MCKCMQVSFYRSNLFLSVVPKAKGQNEEGNDIQLETMIEYIWYMPSAARKADLPHFVKAIC